MVNYILCTTTTTTFFETNIFITTTTFFEIMIAFTTIWALLYENGSAARKEEGTRAYWDTLSPTQQQQVFTTITDKLQKGLFVHYDPIRALRENLRRGQAAEPTFLRGDEGGDLVQVRYNGLYKICTRDTMKAFKLEYVRDW